jgi:hypothetical protein
MAHHPGHIRLRSFLALVGVLFGLALIAQAAPPGDCPLTLDYLRHLSPDELHQLFTDAEVGRPLVGVARGRLLCTTDRHLRRIKVGLSNAFWRGKAAQEDGAFVNCWIGGVQVLDSHYVIGPSWVDGRPALLFDYAPGTPLFGNMHDEVREIAPGLYLGPIYDRCPTPKLRGYLALQMAPCCEHH